MSKLAARERKWAIDPMRMTDPVAIGLEIDMCYARIAHAIERRRHWLDEAETWEREWDMRKAEYIAHEVRAGSRAAGREIPVTPKSATYMFENSPEAKGILAQGVWAHRKHNTYALEIAAEEILIRMLEQRFDQVTGLGHG